MFGSMAFPGYLEALIRFGQVEGHDSVIDRPQ